MFLLFTPNPFLVCQTEFNFSKLTLATEGNTVFPSNPFTTKRNCGTLFRPTPMRFYSAGRLLVDSSKELKNISTRVACATTYVVSDHFSTFRFGESMGLPGMPRRVLER